MAPNVYDIEKEPKTGQTGKFETISAEYVGTGNTKANTSPYTRLQFHRSGSVAYLQAVATRVFEKDRVIGFIFPSGTFDVPRARMDGNYSESIDFRGIFHPERDSVFIWNVAGRFGDTEKRCWSVIRSRGFVLDPIRNFRLPNKAERRQQHFVKGPCLRKLRDAEIDVIVEARHRGAGDLFKQQFFRVIFQII